MKKDKKPLIRVEVAPFVPLPAGKRKTYTYYIPSHIPLQSKEELLYRVVHISFGPRKVKGCIMGFSQGRSFYSVKKVDKVSLVMLTDKQIELGKALAAMMQGGLGFTLRLFMPAAVSYKPETSVIAKKNQTVSKKNLEIIKKIKKGDFAYIEKDSEKRYGFLKILALHNLNCNSQTLIIVPEVWMVKKIEATFNEDKIGFFYAGLSSGKQAQVWHEVANGKISVVIGTQKALFLPWRNLETLVLEEPQYESHKLFDQYPRLHNMIGIKELQKIHQSSLLFLTSFPSLSLFCNIKKNKVTVLHNKTGFIRPQIYNKTFEDRKNKRLLPLEFTEKLKQWLRKKDKILILYNQRGSWSTLYCPSCGKAVACPKCQGSFAIHGTGKGKKMVCHICAFTDYLPQNCPGCQKKSLKYFGVGGEIIEHILNQLSTYCRDLIRIDADTVKEMTGKKIQSEIDKKHLVMGTSALFTHVKGRQFDRVIWLFPERGLQYPDFRSYERSYLLLSRLQMHLKGNKSIAVITKQPALAESVLGEKMDSFYEYQLKERRRLKYPPYNYIVRLTVSGKTLAGALARADKVRKEISKNIKDKKNILVRGPFQGFKRYNKHEAEVHLVLLGSNLSDMITVYHGLPVDVVDVSPQKIV